MLGTAQKSPDAFRTISEVAAELDVPQHVLRFWESKFGSIKPLKRGGGRRYYRPDDIDLLRGIRSLLYSDGLTIKGVQKILREQGARYVMEMGRNATGLLLAAKAPPPAPEPAKEPAPPTNVHPFRRDGAAWGGARRPTMTGGERDRFSALLDELVDLKVRMAAVRGRHS